MSTDYSKRKNAELEDLLKARSLPHTGKKADLVARLQQYDKEHSTSATTPAPAAPTGAPPTEDEIDWEDDTVAAPAPPTTTTTTTTTTPSAPRATALAAGGTGPIPTPLAVPNQLPAEDPSTTTDLTVQPPASTSPPTTTTVPTTTPPFTASLSRTSPTTELAKRAARAARFGLADSHTPSNSTEEASKALERAKRFGGVGGEEEGGNAVKGLDRALPERGARKRGRGGEEERVGKRRGGRERERKNGNGKGGGGGVREKDRVAAEARKKRFAGVV